MEDFEFRTLKYNVFIMITPDQLLEASKRQHTPFHKPCSQITHPKWTSFQPCLIYTPLHKPYSHITHPKWTSFQSRLI